MKTPAPHPAARSWRCPAENALAAYADGALPPTDRARVERHVADCAACRSQLALLAELADSSADAVPPELRARAARIEPARVAPGPVRWLAPAAVTAALVLAVGAGLWQVSRGRIADDAPPLRGEASAATEPRVLVPEPEAQLGVAADVRWTPVDGVDDYQVTVKREDGGLVWERFTEAPTARLPADIALEDGERAFLVVAARLADGRVLSSSGVTFRYREDR